MNEYTKRVLILLSIIIGGFIFDGLITAISRLNVYSQDNYIVNIGYIGSYLSGVTSLVIVVLTILAVKYSYNAYKEEVRRVKQQRLEDRFYHLLTMHRDNVEGMIIDLKVGRLESSKVILNIFRELEVIIKILNIKEICEKYKSVANFKIQGVSARDEELFNTIKEMGGVVYNEKNGENFDKKLINVKVAFLIMFLGCGERSSKIVRNYLLQFEDYFNVNEIIKLFSNNDFRNKVQKSYNFKYKLFGGHQSRLGHYFRNMFHIVKFIDSDEGLSFEQKNSYVKNFRVQLNTFEQVLLLVNAVSIFGEDWQKYIVKYKLVKNIPKDFFRKDLWFDMECEIKKMAEANEKLIRNEYKLTVVNFVSDYFEFSTHKLRG
ncbi:putative phage abortive infection protein [Acinetobacter dispersus]|uniref:putative phage abortive infection protein n=1 Tax=Acinetobacter dispersus TaxID=70348 RepID=UPI00132EFD0E|nr:putative phage abortive infection protein [Acinetobacter dispersus]QHH96667.1 hypothetical protein FPL17_03580 [Acinetobacter dispersus]